MELTKCTNKRKNVKIKFSEKGPEKKVKRVKTKP